MSESIYNCLKLSKKECYLRYISLVAYPEDYEKITRKEMLAAILKLYLEKEHYLLLLLSDEELDILASNRYSKLQKLNGKCKFLEDLFLFVKNEKGEYELARELEKMVGEELAYYDNNKMYLESKKTPTYYILGLLRLYGVLTFPKISKLLEKYGHLEQADFVNYIDRFAKVIYYQELLGLRDATYFAEGILAKQPEKIVCDLEKETIIALGKKVFDETTTAYNLVIANSKLKEVLEEIDREKLALEVGLDSFDEKAYLDLKEKYKLSDLEFESLINYFLTLPNYLK